MAMGMPIYDFVNSSTYGVLPLDVQGMASRCLLDLLGTGAVGAQTELARLATQHAWRFFGPGGDAAAVPMLFDGRKASCVGAALAGGMMIDSYDAHDGHVLTKGHAGCAILPGLLALCAANPDRTSGAEFLTALVVGYEIAIRCGIAQHRISCDYHTSGAWNALGVAAVAARLGRLDASQLREALGIAEYHGPRSQMMRCIDFPTMVKDGSGWGAMTGVSAAYLAADGFSGAPALVVEDERVADLWGDLGERWRIRELYFKPHPVCRWAQPAIEAVLSLTKGRPMQPHEISLVEIETFHNAVRLDQYRPASTEAAQYSLPFPVAAAIAHGTLRPSDIMSENLGDPEVLSLSHKIRLVECPKIEARFPAERLARARIRLHDGQELQSATLSARGDAATPLTDMEIETKFHTFAASALGSARAELIHRAVVDLPDCKSLSTLIALVCAPVTNKVAS